MSCRLLIGLILFLPVIWILDRPLKASEENLHELYQVNAAGASESLPGLDLNLSDAKVQWDASMMGSELSLLLGGHYLGRASLVVDRSRIKPGPTGAFQVKVPVTENPQRVTFAAVEVNGDVTLQTVELQIDNFEQLRRHPWLASTRRWQMQGELNYAHLTYQDYRVNHFSESAISATAGLTYVIAPLKWSVAGDAGFTLLPFGHGENPSAREINLAARLGYSGIRIAPDWQLTLFAGARYALFYTSPSRFGYRNLAGPQVSSALKHFWNARDFSSAQIWLTTFTSGFHLPSLNDREIAFGLDYLRRFRDSSELGPCVKYAFKNVTIQGLPMHDTSLFIGVRYAR